MGYEQRNWDEWEKVQYKKQMNSFCALGTDALAAAVESSVHWNRMYAELMEQQRNDIRDSRATPPTTDVVLVDRERAAKVCDRHAEIQLRHGEPYLAEQSRQDAIAIRALPPHTKEHVDG